MATKRSAEFWQEHLKNWRQSGQTLIAYCVTHKIGRSTLSRWQAKERQSTRSDSKPVTLISVNAPVPARTVNTPSPEVISLRSPAGWQIQCPCIDANELAKLLRELP